MSVKGSRLWQSGVRECYYCSRPFKSSTQATRDHRIPKSRRNENLEAFNLRSNVVLACKPCNFEKGSMTDTEYEALRRMRGLPVPSHATMKKYISRRSFLLGDIFR